MYRLTKSSKIKKGFFLSNKFVHIRRMGEWSELTLDKRIWVAFGVSTSSSYDSLFSLHKRGVWIFKLDHIIESPTKSKSNKLFMSMNLFSITMFLFQRPLLFFLQARLSGVKITYNYPLLLSQSSGIIQFCPKLPFLIVIIWATETDENPTYITTYFYELHWNT